MYTYAFAAVCLINPVWDPNSNDPVVLLMRAVCSGFAERRSWQLAVYKCKRDCLFSFCTIRGLNECMMLGNARGQAGEGSGKRDEEGSGVLVVMLP